MIGGTLPYRILGYRDIPNSIAKKILEEYLSKLHAVDVVAEPARSALEYLQIVSKCDPEKAEELIEKLQLMKLKDITIALILNICPSTLDELRMLLAFETVTPEETELNKILDLVKEYCG
uniref:DNA-directed RNA polymerase subunit Rpo4 n=1 Tax=Ignisphaera aggregans TaxID=334771 RepID=A0A7C4D155_9CREN